MGSLAKGEEGDPITESSIIVEGLVKRFGELTAVDNISFSVSRGEFFGLLGPNGAGKTTTIRMLNGILRPNQGKILIDNIDLRKNPLEAKMKLGCIPEVGTVYPDLSARENLDLMGRFYGLDQKAREARSEELLKALNLADRGDDLLRKFSKGMKQRVSIACAMIHEPPILFLDEPTEGLDVQSRRLIIDLVKKLNAKGSTIMLTTHNIEEANRLCQRVCIINKGKIVCIEAPENLRRTYEKGQTVEVAFDRKVDLNGIALPNITKIEAAGDKWRFSTEDPDAAMEGIMRLRQEKGLKVVSITTLGPSLEDVFVKLTSEGVCR
jgi:ABC-2 type transport system ATP-binding protein